MSPTTPVILGASIGWHTNMCHWMSGWTTEEWGVFFTLLTAVAIFGQWAAMLRTNKHFRITERAYVRLSHVTEGRRAAFDWLQGGAGEATMQIEIKNCGRSPARVTGVWLGGRCVPDGKEFPTYFSYREGHSATASKIGRAFLMPSDQILIPWALNFSPEEYEAVELGNATLIIFGYVDYIDQFGDHYRGGYGRQLIPQTFKNNLGFPDCPAKLNFDEPRTKGAWLDRGTQFSE